LTLRNVGQLNVFFGGGIRKWVRSPTPRVLVLLYAIK